jgi:hypothetical protein
MTHLPPIAEGLRTFQQRLLGRAHVSKALFAIYESDVAKGKQYLLEAVLAYREAMARHQLLAQIICDEALRLPVNGPFADSARLLR